MATVWVFWLQISRITLNQDCNYQRLSSWVSGDFQIKGFSLWQEETELSLKYEADSQRTCSVCNVLLPACCLLFTSNSRLHAGTPLTMLMLVRGMLIVANDSCPPAVRTHRERKTTFTTIKALWMKPDATTHPSSQHSYRAEERTRKIKVLLQENVSWQNVSYVVEFILFTFVSRLWNWWSFPLTDLLKKTKMINAADQLYCSVCVSYWTQCSQ